MAPKFKIIIIGAGVAGLAAAIALSRQGHSVTVYERRKNTSEQSGSGVQIQPTGVQILKKWGLLEGLGKVAHDCGEVKFRGYKTGEIIARQERIGIRGQWYALRNDLRRFLYETAIASGAVIYFERKAQSVDLETPSVTLVDGSIMKADLLIAADGMYSTIRKAMHPTSETKVLEQCVFQAVIPRETMYQHQETRELYDDRAMCVWLGQGAFGFSSVAPAQNVYDVQMVFLKFSDADDANPKQLLEPLRRAEFVEDKIRDWNPIYKMLYKIANSHFKWRIVESPYVSTAVSKSGRVVLIGDSYHGMTPHAGEGSSMGIEDAAVLTELLSYATSTDDISRLMEVYGKIRHTRVEAVRRYSDFCGDTFSYPDGIKQQTRDKILKLVDPNKFLDVKPDMKARYGAPEFLTWLDVFDVENTVRDALEVADDKLSQEKARL